MSSILQNNVEEAIKQGYIWVKNDDGEVFTSSVNGITFEEGLNHPCFIRTYADKSVNPPRLQNYEYKQYVYDSCWAVALEDLGSYKQKVVRENFKPYQIGFWKPHQQFGELSNWYKCNFIYKNNNFSSAEQALMFEKAKTFSDMDTAEKILKEQDPAKIKQLGRQVKNYDDDIWGKKRYVVMANILSKKFNQNPHCARRLLETYGATLYEASPFDKIWGIGSADVNIINGENLLGQALMEVRLLLQCSKKF